MHSPWQISICFDDTIRGGQLIKSLMEATRTRLLHREIATREHPRFAREGAKKPLIHHGKGRRDKVRDSNAFLS